MYCERIDLVHRAAIPVDAPALGGGITAAAANSLDVGDIELVISENQSTREPTSGDEAVDLVVVGKVDDSDSVVAAVGDVETTGVFVESECIGQATEGKIGHRSRRDAAGDGSRSGIDDVDPVRVDAGDVQSRSIAAQYHVGGMQTSVDEGHLFAARIIEALIIEIDEGDAAAGADSSFVNDHVGAR